MIDNEECTVTVKEIEIADRLIVRLAIENKSDSEEYLFSVKGLAINGISMDELHAMNFKRLPAGEKADWPLTVFKDTLRYYGVDQDPTDIEVRIVVGDPNGNDDEPAADETFHVYPYGESKAVRYVYEPADNHHVLLDTDDVKIVQVGLDDENIEVGNTAYAFRLYIENKSDAAIQLHSTQGSVNGYQNNLFFSNIIGAGKSCFASWYILEDTVKENDIETLEEAEIRLSMNNYDSHETFFIDTIKLVP